MSAREAAALAGLQARVAVRQVAASAVLMQVFAPNPRRLPDPSFARIDRDAAWAARMLGRVAAIDRFALDHAGRIGWLLAEWRLRDMVEAASVARLTFQVTPYSSWVLQLADLLRGMSLRTPADRRRHAGAVAQLAGRLDALRDNLLAQRAAGVLIPRPQIDQTIPFIEGFIEPPERHFAAQGVAGPEQAACAGLIAEEVNPALRRLADALGGDYRDAAPAEIGLCRQPGGEGAYRLLIRRDLGLDLEPDAIHRAGHAEIARLVAEMEPVAAQAGWGGDVAGFRRALAEDPAFRPKSGEEYAATLMRTQGKARDRMADFFLAWPKAPARVEALPAEREATQTFGYYLPPIPGVEKAGVYYFNAATAVANSCVEAVALISHELLPGHHVEAALAVEATGLPLFRRLDPGNGFMEAWAEYASGVIGREMGLYEDPIDLAGRIEMDLDMAVRLVVDTGLNAFGWTIDQAAGFMRAHTRLAEAQIATEILRYGADMPAQALAYRLGALRLEELRRAHEARLGPAFDVRAFHQAMFDGGTMPLHVLATHLSHLAEQTLAARAAEDIP